MNRPSPGGNWGVLAWNPNLTLVNLVYSCELFALSTATPCTHTAAAPRVALIATASHPLARSGDAVGVGAQGGADVARAACQRAEGRPGSALGVGSEVAGATVTLPMAPKV